MPAGNASAFLPRAREAEVTGFTSHHLWVTPYRHGQYYAAGAYPNQSKRDYADTLHHYADRSSVYDQDIVVWYSLGDTHVPRPEDFPVISSKLAVFCQLSSRWVLRAESRNGRDRCQRTGNPPLTAIAYRMAKPLPEDDGSPHHGGANVAATP
jgi:hypothetical protein